MKPYARNSRGRGSSELPWPVPASCRPPRIIVSLLDRAFPFYSWRCHPEPGPAATAGRSVRRRSTRGVVNHFGCLKVLFSLVKLHRLLLGNFWAFDCHPPADWLFFQAHMFEINPPRYTRNVPTQHLASRGISLWSLVLKAPPVRSVSLFQIYC